MQQQLVGKDKVPTGQNTIRAPNQRFVRYVEFGLVPLRKNLIVQMKPILTFSCLLFLVCPGFADDRKTSSAEKSTMEKKTRIHRLATTKRSVFDAFSYLNRLPEKPNDEETPEEFTSRIFSRLANQEGRVLLKAPPGMDRQAYDGFKTFFRDTGKSSVGNCSACHRLPDFSDSKSHVVTKSSQAAATLSLRNIGKRNVDLRAALTRKIDAVSRKKSGEADTISDKYSKIQLSAEDVSNLIAFLKLLDDASDERFRELILNAKVLDTLKE